MRPYPLFARLPATVLPSFEKQRVQAAVRARLLGRPTQPLRIGRYRVLDRIGQGAHGIVYRAHDPRLDRVIALKVVWTADGGRHASVLAEAHALAKLAHPGVVAVYDAGVCDGSVFIAMEFVEGRTLRDWFAGGPRSERETIQVLLDAGRGLAAAHRAGLVHRDVKPSNIMVDRDGRARVLDFGLALRGPALREGTTTPAGTPGYIAPEQRRGARPTARSDQYAFCVTFHEALTLQQPAVGALGRAWLRFARPILARGLRPDPAQRHASMAALVGRFERRRKLYVAAGLASSALMGSAITGSLLT